MVRPYPENKGDLGTYDDKKVKRLVKESKKERCQSWDGETIDIEEDLTEGV